MAVGAVTVLAMMVVCSEAAMTSDQETKVLDRHNKVRSETALRSNSKWANEIPCTAADMEKMVWDTTLATEAQSYAEGCVADHPADAGSKFGENLFFGTGGTACDTACLESGVQAWYDEIVDTIWTINDKSPKSKALSDCKDVSGSYCNVGHYFQVIEATTNQVGCGVAACPSLTSSGSAMGAGYLMVCRYQKPGKNNGKGTTYQPPFLFGAAGAACAGNVENGLCTKAPTRCVDKDPISITLGATKYTSCATIAKDANVNGMKWCGAGGLAEFMSAEGDCPASCATCTPPANMGSQHCGTSVSGNTQNTAAQTTAAQTTAAQTSGNTAAPTTAAPAAASKVTLASELSFNMSAQHADSLKTNITRSKMIFAQAIQATIGGDATVVVNKIFINGVLAVTTTVTEGGRRLSSDSAVKVEFEVTTTRTAAQIKQNLETGNGSALQSSISTVAQAQGMVLVVTTPPAVAAVVTATAAPSSGSGSGSGAGSTSGTVHLSVRTGLVSALIAFFTLG